MKESAEKDLEAAKPALESALAALNSITPKDIASLKALKNPPDIVKRIFDCVLLLRSGLYFWIFTSQLWTRSSASQSRSKSLQEIVCLGKEPDC